jgi:hypothetical protein
VPGKLCLESYVYGIVYVFMGKVVCVPANNVLGKLYVPERRVYWKVGCTGKLWVYREMMYWERS